MRTLITAVLLLLTACVVQAQSVVTVTGPVTPGNCVQFASVTIVKDSGISSCGGNGGITIGAPITGACTNGSFFFNNAGVIGCEAAAGTGTVTSGGGGIVPTSTTTTLFIEQMNPGGRITPSSGVPIPISDAVAATTIYYAPLGAGKYVPVYDGTNMILRQFTASDTDTIGQSIALGSNWAANTIYDGFEGLNSGVATFCTGPAWSNSGAGTSARGTGAGTAELELFKGILTNKNSMTCRYSNTQTFTCGVHQCTFLGSFRTNGNAGQVDLKFGTSAVGGGTACLCIWNAYNQVQAAIKVADMTASNTTGNTWRPYLNDAGNSINFLSGLQNQGFSITVAGAFTLAASFGSTGRIGVALNNPTPTLPDFQGVSITAQTGTPLGVSPSVSSTTQYPAQLGYNIVYELENSFNTAPASLGGGTFFQFISGIMWW
jgi:hypothetical protein